MKTNGEVLHWLRASQSTLESYRLDPVFLRVGRRPCMTPPIPPEPEPHLQYFYGIDLPQREVDRNRGQLEISDDYKLRLLASASTACFAVGRELHLLQPLYLLPKDDDHRDRTVAQAEMIATLAVLTDHLLRVLGYSRLPYPPHHLRALEQLGAHLSAELELAKKVGVLPLVAAEKSKPR